MDMMNKMMQSMIRNMTIEQKQELLHKMMPKMMKETDPQILIPNILKETGKIISVYSIYELIYKFFQDKELKSSFTSNIKKAKDKFKVHLPAFFAIVKPIAMKVTPKAMSLFKPMMPGMMTIMEDESLIKEVSPNVKKEMANCMSSVMPVWLNSLYPLIDHDKKKVLNKKIGQITSLEKGTPKA